MAMHTAYLKEYEGIVQNPIGQLSSAAAPWWSGLRSQSSHSESFGQFRSSSVGRPSNGSQHTATNQAENGSEKGLEKGNPTPFTIFPGNMPVQLATPGYRSHFELGFGQPVICTKYPYGDQYYGVLSTYGPQITGRIMLPSDLTTNDGPVYVNAKQYHGILRRRQSRAKAESENKVPRVHRKPYLHLSRHLHAMRRPRGIGGRFLNTKISDGDKCGTETEKIGNGQISQPTESQNSEVVQSDSGNLISPKEANGRSNFSGSEVTSIFSRGDLDRFELNHFRSSVFAFSDMINTGHGMATPASGLQQRMAAATSKFDSKGADGLGAKTLASAPPFL